MKCYSYIRWSSAPQTHGDSLRRQTALAENYAKKHGLELDLTSYQDHGISAFKGKNVERSLGAFLKAIDNGQITTPCLLLVEALDRITRTEIDVALDLFLSIIKRDVTIVTLQTEQTFSKETIKRDKGISLIIAISMLVQGHEDSAKRGQRIKEVYVARRQRGEIAHNKFPSWLRKVDKKTFAVVPEKAATIHRIFDMALAGYGSRIIARTLNKEGVRTLAWAKEWNQSLISQLLRSKSVYGEKDEHEGYYPPVMTKDKFLATKAAVSGRKWKATRAPSVPNLFAGLSFCAICGSRVRYMPNTDGNPHIRCKRSADDLDCDSKAYPYNASEAAFIYTMTRKAGLDISGEYIVKSASKAPAIKGEIEELKEKQRKLAQLAVLSPDVAVVADELNLVQRHIKKLEKELHDADAIPLSRREIDAHRDLFDRYLHAKENGNTDIVEIKRQVRVAMARLFKKIEFGVGKKGWEPTLFLTLVDGTRAAVDVVPFLPKQSLAFHKNRKWKRNALQQKAGKRA